MKVLFVTSRYPTPQTPGDSPVIRQSKEALEALGHTVDVLYIDSRMSKKAYLPALLKMPFAAAKYDVVHGHYGWLTALVARFQFRAPVVVTFRGDDVLNPRESWMSRALVKTIDYAITMSDEMKRKLGRADTLVMPYGIDSKIFKPEPRAVAREKLGLHASKPYVFFAFEPSRPTKAFHLVEGALALLKKDFPDVELISIWDKPHDVVARYMNACDVLVNTSLWEGSPSSVREALACNMPVVGVDAGDTWSHIKTIENCYTAERDAADIAAKLKAVLASGARCNGRPTAEKLSIEACARRVEQIYQDVTKRGRQGVTA
jgi:teichuronic acid biosynthesis glycosyltransferase TuaC